MWNHKPWTHKPVDLGTLEGEVIESIEGLEEGSRCAVFKTVSGRTIYMLHYQDCSESVDIQDIAGDMEDLIGSEILLAELVSNDPPADHEPSKYGSETWTFYKLATTKGYVTIRWYGSSNGYYSEEVSIVEAI